MDTTGIFVQFFVQSFMGGILDGAHLGILRGEGPNERYVVEAGHEHLRDDLRRERERRSAQTRPQPPPESVHEHRTHGEWGQVQIVPRECDEGLL